MFGKKTVRRLVALESIQTEALNELAHIRRILGGVSGMVGTIETHVGCARYEASARHTDRTGMSERMRAEIRDHADRQLAAARATLAGDTAGDTAGGAQ